MSPRTTSRLLALLTVAPIVCAPLFACGDDGGGASDTAADTADTSDTHDSNGPDLPDAEETSDDTSEPDTADTTDTADAADTSDVPDGDTVEPPPSLTVERYGARLWGPIIQMSRTGRVLWLGTRANPDPVSGVLRAGLYRLDLDTGAVRVYEDELPLEDYHLLDPFIPEGTFGPTATAGVEALGDGRYLAVAHTGLLLIDGGSITPFPVTDDGAPVVPIQLAISEPGVCQRPRWDGTCGTPIAWLTSDRGLFRLNRATFAVEQRITGADLGLAGDTGGSFGKLALDSDSGAVYAAYYASNATSHVVRVAADGAIAVLTPGTNGLPAGLVGELAWSFTRGRVYVALGAWNAAEGGVVAWDGVTSSEVVREGALAAAHTGESGPFGAQALALDDERGLLAVGGQVQSGFAGQKGGGLVVVDLTSTPPRVVGLRTRTTPLYHWHTNHLAWDGQGGRLYAAMSDLCSEVKLRNRGLFALSFDAAGDVRYERPLLSGVRAIGFDDEGETPWLGLRDDNGGLACETYPIQTGLGHAQGGGSLALYPVLATSTDGGGGMLLDPGVTALDAHAGLALGTYRDGFFLGAIVEGAEGAGGRAEGFAGNQALLGPSLFTEDVLHEVRTDGADGLWIAGRTSHGQGDPPQLADRGPRGAALITLRDGRVEGVTHYVRASEDADDVVGLPSGDVRDLLREADGSVLAACAAERVDLPYDRMETPIFEVDGVPRMGGLARLSGDSVEVLAGAEVLPDPRALTRDAAGRLWVADAERGVLRLDDGEWIEVPLAGLPADAVPQAIWAGAGDDLALASSRGLWVRLSGRVLILDDVGFAWSLAYKNDRLFVGTDTGLLVVRPSNAPATVLPPAPAGAPPPFGAR